MAAARALVRITRATQMVSPAQISPRPENAWMDSTTLLGLAGISGTILGTAVGAGGTLGSARITSRGQANVEEHKARRQVYSACATALLARRDAAVALLETFAEDSFDPAAVQVLLQNLDEQRDGVARAVGAVAVEGPDAVANSAEYAARAVEQLAGRLRDWLASIVGGENREVLIQSQLRYGRHDQLTVEEDVDHFTAECRKVLHPAESGRPARRRLRRR
jgi:hypothetical protein